MRGRRVHRERLARAPGPGDDPRRHRGALEQHRLGDGRRAIGSAELASVLARFGYGSPTGVGFPGEAGGVVPELLRLDRHHPDDDRLRAGDLDDAAPDGRGLRDRGERRDVGAASSRARHDRGGRLVEEAPGAPAPRRVLSEQTASMLTRMLASVVETGTGGAAQIPGYQVAGKTGTARKLVDGRYVRRYMASFVGFLPASDPRVVIVVSIDEPWTVYGGVAAAPVFSEIARHVIQRLAIPAAPPVLLPPLATEPLEAAARPPTTRPPVRWTPVNDFPRCRSPTRPRWCPAPRSGATRRRGRRRGRVRLAARRARRAVLLRAGADRDGHAFAADGDPLGRGRRSSSSGGSTSTRRRSGCRRFAGRWARCRRSSWAIRPVADDRRGHGDEREDDDRAPAGRGVPGRRAPDGDDRHDRGARGRRARRRSRGRRRRRPTSSGCSRGCATTASPRSRWRSPPTRSTRIGSGGCGSPRRRSRTCRRTTWTTTGRWRRTSRPRRRCSRTSALASAW